MWVNIQRITGVPHCANVVWPDLERVMHVARYDRCMEAQRKRHPCIRRDPDPWGRLASRVRGNDYHTSILAQLLGCSVDAGTADSLQPRLRSHVLAESMRVA